jgi:hypothetical protein
MVQVFGLVFTGREEGDETKQFIRSFINLLSAGSLRFKSLAECFAHPDIAELGQFHFQLAAQRDNIELRIRIEANEIAPRCPLPVQADSSRC